MANYYWAGTTSGLAWHTTGTLTRWQNSAGTYITTVPGSGDDVFFDGRSQLTCGMTTSVTRSCRSLNTTGYTGTLNFTAGTLNIGDAAAGAGAVALKLSSGMTFTVGGTLNFVSTSTTQQSITCAGKTLPITNFNGATNSSYVLAGNFASTGLLTITSGTLDTDPANNWTISSSGLTSTSGNTRSLIFNNSTINIGLGNWNVVSTGLTNSATAFSNCTIEISVAALAITFAGAGLSYGTLNTTSWSTFTSASLTITGSNTFVNFHVLVTDAYPPRTADLIFVDGTTQTITNVINMGGNVGKRLTVRSTTGGNQFILSKNISNVPFGRRYQANWITLIDARATGETKWFAANSIDNGNNVGWRFNNANEGVQSLLDCGI